MLYLCVNWAYPEGLEQYPIVHAYRVRNESAASRQQVGSKTMRWTIDHKAK